MDTTAPLPPCGHRFLDICPGTRTAAEHHARIGLQGKLAQLEKEIDYYRRRRDRVANHHRLWLRDHYRSLLKLLVQPLTDRHAFGGGSIDEIVIKWLVDPSIVDVACEDSVVHERAVQSA